MPKIPRKKFSMNIVETAVSNSSLSTLVAAVKAAGLVEALSGAGPFTVFAPSDDAFAKLPAGTIENLVKPENKSDLTALLQLHVVSGQHMAADLAKMNADVATLGGARVMISSANGDVMVDGAKVVIADVSCSNGVVHVIDTVLTPALTPAE